jgi:hypothetical protein
MSRTSPSVTNKVREDAKVPSLLTSSCPSQFVDTVGLGNEREVVNSRQAAQGPTARRCSTGSNFPVVLSLIIPGFALSDPLVVQVEESFDFSLF